MKVTCTKVPTHLSAPGSIPNSSNFHPYTWGFSKQDISRSITYKSVFSHQQRSAPHVGVGASHTTPILSQSIPKVDSDVCNDIYISPSPVLLETGEGKIIGRKQKNALLGKITIYTHNLHLTWAFYLNIH